MGLGMIYKNVVSSFSYHSGWEARKMSILADNGAIFVLAYHRVLTREDMEHQFIQPGMYVLQDTFRRQMEYLRRRFRPFPLEELGQDINRSDTGKTIGFIVTFDDGWKDNYENALPVLQEMSLGALFFLPTAYIGTKRWFWSEKLAHVVKLIYQGEGCAEGIELQQRIAGKIPDTQLSRMLQCPARRRIDLFDELTLTWKSMESTNREEWLKEISKIIQQMGLPQWETSRMMMNWDEVADMQRAGMELGSHTHNHRILTRLPREEVELEMAMSKSELAERLNYDARAFAYPNGDLNQDIAGLASEHYRYSFGMNTGPVYPGNPLHPMARIPIHEDISHKEHLFSYRLSSASRG